MNGARITPGRRIDTPAQASRLEVGTRAAEVWPLGDLWTKTGPDQWTSGDDVTTDSGVVGLKVVTITPA